VIIFQYMQSNWDAGSRSIILIMLQPFAAGVTIVMIRRRKQKIDETGSVCSSQNLSFCIWVRFHAYGTSRLNLFLQNGYFMELFYLLALSVITHSWEWVYGASWRAQSMVHPPQEHSITIISLCSRIPSLLPTKTFYFKNSKAFLTNWHLLPPTPTPSLIPPP